MSEVLGANGNELTITIPSSGERDWATSIRDNCFQKISDHSHEGSGLGKKLRGYLAIDQTEAILANNTTLKARDNAGSATIDVLKVTTGDEVEISTTVASADFQDDGLTVSDNADNTKKIALQASAITTATTRTLTMADENVDLAALKNSNISASAAIALSKLAAVTASRALVSDGSGFVSASSVTSTELGYVSGVTSAIQTQIDALPDTGTANEITLTGTTIGLADNPVIPGTDSMVVPVGTTAQRSSTTAGALRYNSTLAQFEGYNNGAWGSIGGGGGGLDIFHDEDFAVTAASDFTTGQAATPDAVGTGTLGGTLGEESSTQIAGTKSLKYTMNATAASSDNDFFLNDADITLDVKQQANFLGIDFYYTYTGADDDIRFFVLDDSDNELTLSNEYLKSASTATRFSTSIYVGSSVTGIRYGFQVVSGNSSKVLLIDDVQITTNPFVYKNLSEYQSGELITTFVSGLSDVTGALTSSKGSGLFSYNSGTGEYTILQPCEFTITSSAKDAGSDVVMYIKRNGTIIYSDRSDDPTRFVSLGGAVNAVAGDVFIVSVGSSLQVDDIQVFVTARTEAEHVITPAKSNLTGWTAYTPTYTGFGTVSTQSVFYRRIGDSMEIKGTFTAGTCTAVTAQVSLPSGLSYDTNAHTNSGANDMVGTYVRNLADANSGGPCLINVTNGTIEFGPVTIFGATANAPLTSATATSMCGTGNEIAFKCTVPISEWDTNLTFLAAVPTNVQNNASDYVTESGITIEGTTSNPTKPTTVDTDEIIWAQAGQNIKATYKYYAASTSGAAAGSGDYLFTLPNGLSFDSNVVDFYSTVEGWASPWQVANGNQVGNWSAGDGGGNAVGVVIPYDATRFRLMGMNATSYGVVGSSAYSTTSAETFTIQIDAPIEGWTSAGTFLSATPKNETAYVKDVKAANTAGGTFTSGAWQTRDLNDLSGDTSWISLSSNQFTLDAGKYQIEVEAPSYDVGAVKAIVYNTSDSSNELIGMSQTADTSGAEAISLVKGVINISSSKTFEVRHRCNTTRATNGFGVASNMSVDEVYTTVKITKIP